MNNYIYEDGLQTERLYTRFLVPDDYKAWTKFFEDKEAIEFFPSTGFVSNEERSKHWIERQLSRYRDNRFGLQALFNKETKEFIGQCGLLLQEVDGQKELEVGYHIFKKYWRQGYATEAAIRFRDYGFENNLSNSIISIINTKNVKSQRVATKNGMILEKQVKWLDMDVFIYRIRKSD